mmetsp:Transcript_38411/g.109798  ORF Transcript_38411/g.109798 Transcript_38411/m.109798 type:complete len:207 (-) Transcript_38411:756-1376(-)
MHLPIVHHLVIAVLLAAIHRTSVAHPVHHPVVHRGSLSLSLTITLRLSPIAGGVPVGHDVVIGRLRPHQLVTLVDVVIARCISVCVIPAAIIVVHDVFALLLAFVLAVAGRRARGTGGGRGGVASGGGGTGHHLLARQQGGLVRGGLEGDVLVGGAEVPHGALGGLALGVLDGLRVRGDPVALHEEVVQPSGLVYIEADDLRCLVS